MYIVTVTH